jgi:hypothetical protein
LRDHLIRRGVTVMALGALTVARDSGRPIAGLMLHAAVFSVQNFIPHQYRGINATTNAHGRYCLTGLPKAPAYRLSIEQSEGSRYPSATFRAPAESPAFEPVNFDISLKRGVVIRGRVTDVVPPRKDSQAFEKGNA